MDGVLSTDEEVIVGVYVSLLFYVTLPVYVGCCDFSYPEGDSTLGTYSVICKLVETCYRLIKVFIYPF
jgi:hypothetical protein